MGGGGIDRDQKKTARTLQLGIRKWCSAHDCIPTGQILPDASQVPQTLSNPT